MFLSVVINQKCNLGDEQIEPTNTEAKRLVFAIKKTNKTIHLFIARPPFESKVKILSHCANVLIAIANQIFSWEVIKNWNNAYFFI